MQGMPKPQDWEKRLVAKYMRLNNKDQIFYPTCELDREICAGIFAVIPNNESVVHGTLWERGGIWQYVTVEWANGDRCLAYIGCEAEEPSWMTLI